jgi:hypothetical protein
MDHCVSEICILPLQTQALGDSKARACSQERQGSFKISGGNPSSKKAEHNVRERRDLPPWNVEHVLS